MDRILEPELMDEEDQARAYSEADFSEPHNMFVEEFKQTFPLLRGTNKVLDLGCGPADVTVRFAQAFPGSRIDAVDGAKTMLRYGQARINQENLVGQITLIHEILPATNKLHRQYDVIFSNSLLHHLADPATLWDTIRNKCADNGSVFIMDLMRPASKYLAKKFVELYASNEPEVLQHDFYHSLLAAHRPEEVETQLEKADLDWLNVKAITDRHLIVYGQRPVCT